MFFIDNDKTQILEGQEQRRACARDNPHLPFHHLPPDALARLRGEIGMPFRGL